MTVINAEERKNWKLPATCPVCNEDSAIIWIHEYAMDYADIVLCKDCAMQLVRKLSEDLCVFTKGGRNG